MRNLKHLTATLKNSANSLCSFDKYLLGTIVLLSAATLLTALLATPNNFDSLTYHLPRLVMWLQNRSLDFFPTPDYRLLYNPPLAELAQSHIWVLSNYTDSTMNLVQWLSFIMLGISGSLIAKSMGAGKTGQIITTFFLLTSPLAVLEAATTQNDLLTASLLLSSLSFWLPIRHQFTVSSWTWGCISAGLSIATKATSIMFIPFIMLLPAIWSLRSRRKLATLSAMALLLIPSTGWLYRNTVFFESPLGYHDDYSADHRINYYRNQYLSPKQIVGCTAKNASLLLATPVRQINTIIEKLVVALHSLTGLDVNDEQLRWYETMYHVPLAAPNEDNPPAAWHSLLALLLIIAILAGAAKRRTVSAESLLAIITIFGFIASTSYVKWMPWNSRFLAIWVLISITFYAHIIIKLPRTLTASLCGLFIVMAIPMATLATKRSWVTFSIPYSGASCQFTGVTLPKETQLTAPNLSLAPDLRDIVDAAAALRPKHVGIVRGGMDSAVFPFVTLLRTASPKTTFHFIGISNRTRYLMPTPNCDMILHIDSGLPPHTPESTTYLKVFSCSYGSLWQPLHTQARQNFF